MEEETERRGQSKSQVEGEKKRNGRLVGAAEISKERAEWRKLKTKNLSILSLLKRKEWPRCQEAVGRYAGAALAKRRRNRVVCPEYQIMRGGESRWARAAPWRERRRSKRKRKEEKVESTVKEGRFQAGD